ncbi:hypothetical protein [Desulfosporosinus lacus]|uniref:Amino acid kinase family protein n=1 Tax=Desulfosporosinus lacus DSM 15449 TaxID=1121420 RepID=A0A1M6A021_9FIRM|nr:hypothetical protein [Desulfosporosinus lacus]SHI29854.1 Amino acid kinase family protein [Desulfosporosinus lacus DSM 15449]
MQKPIIIKLGGSLIYNEGGQALQELGNILQSLSAQHSLVIIPGGGPFADSVRDYGERLNLSDPTCHFMALLAMDQFAYVLQSFIPGSRLTYLTDPLSFQQASIPSSPQILLCSHYLSLVPPEDLPRSWDVTSDSISAYLAKQLDASLLVLLKSVDIDPAVKEPDVDAYFHEALSPNLPVWFLNGLHPQRLAELLESGYTQGVHLGPKRSAFFG